MFHSIQICYSKILNNSPSNRIFKKLTLKIILTLKEIHHFKKASCQRPSKDQTNHFSKILCIIDEVTNFLITVPIFQARSEEIREALIENVITKFCIPEYIIMDQDSACTSSLITYLFHKFNIKIKTVAPYNHQSLQTEHVIKSLTCILTKQLTNLGQMWTKTLIISNICIQHI